MVLGESVEGIFCEGWRFVASDVHDIAGAVRRENPDARLVCNPETRAIGVVEWFARELMGDVDIEKEAGVPIQSRGGTWYRSFDWTHQDGTPITDEPDDRIVAEMRRRDNTKNATRFNPAAYVAMCEKAAELAEADAERALREQTRAIAEREVHRYMKQAGQKEPRIFMPRVLRDGSR